MIKKEKTGAGNGAAGQIHEAVKKHKKFKNWQKIVCVLAVPTLLLSAYSMCKPAATLNQETFCNIEEHVHTEDCYEKALTCGLEEAHVHTDACYEDRTVLTCTIPERDSAVLSTADTEGTAESEEGSVSYPVDEEGTASRPADEEESVQEEHSHTDACYEHHQELVCGLSENQSEHIHTEECFEKKLICGKEEHIHSLACFSDPNADLEDAEIWERSLNQVVLTDNPAENLIAIAESQIGYTESTKNYTVEEDSTVNGYTRYGAWYGMPYGDWGAMFVSFCMNYAGISEAQVPYENDCGRWLETLAAQNRYQPLGTAEPAEGQLVFLDLENGDGIADHVGIAAEVKTGESGTPVSIDVIVGDFEGSVVKAEFALDNMGILGVADLLNEVPEEAVDETDDLGESDLPDANSVVTYGDTEALYVGFHDGPSRAGKFYAMPFEQYISAYSAQERVDNADVVYCFNAHYDAPYSNSDGTLHQPTGQGDAFNAYSNTCSVYHRLDNPSSSVFTQLAVKERLIGDALKRKVTSIGLDGYPHNYSGIQGSLTDAEYRVVTQYALWYYTDSEDYRGSLKTVAQQKAFDRLINSNLPDDVLNRTAGTFCLYQYDSVRQYNSWTGQWGIVSGVKQQQNLLSVGKLSEVITPVTTSLELEKAVTGSQGDKNKDFNFTLVLMDKNGVPLVGNFPCVLSGQPVTLTFQKADKGTISFPLKDKGKLVVNGLPEGFRFQITEAEANQDGYTTAITADPEHSSELQITSDGITSPQNGISGEVKVRFENHKELPAKYEAEIRAVKTLDGQKPGDELFTFVLKDKDGNEIESQNDADGNIVFSMEYSEAGTYHYTLTEKDDSQDGIIYDTSEKHIQVVIKAGKQAVVKYDNKIKPSEFHNEHSFVLPETGGGGVYGYIGGGMALVFVSVLSLYMIKHVYRKEERQ